ncbi:hypothetical protein E2C01_058275 [Portunus trituberculatus]|uniref:Uncharacterized protein n=1 Tax=Portunus trituberculatus TaxID=210409 RepID=A0A5B7H5M4_PORTR|nr:hypothetical protein [Portunus trituberculatus]
MSAFPILFLAAAHQLHLTPRYHFPCSLHRYTFMITTAAQSPHAIRSHAGAEGCPGPVPRLDGGLLALLTCQGQVQGHHSPYREFEYSTPHSGILSPFISSLVMEWLVSLISSNGKAHLIDTNDSVRSSSMVWQQDHCCPHTGRQQ